VLSTSLVPVRLRPAVGGAAVSGTFVFTVPTRGGTVIAEAEVLPADLAAARTRWRSGIRAAAVAVVAFSLLLAAAPVLERRRRVRDAPTFVAHTLTAAALLIAALALVLYAARGLIPGDVASKPAGLLAIALTVVALAAIVLDIVERRRTASPRVS